MMEIERKILGIDKNAVLRSIKQLKPAPQKTFEGLVRVKYFDFPDRRIFKKHDLLRLREFIPQGRAKKTSAKKSYVEFVYKIHCGVKRGCKHFEEMEFVMHKTGFEEFSKFLLELGLKQTLYYEKKRTNFKWGKIKFELDEHPKIPPFLEIEAAGADFISRAIRALKLQDHEQTADSIGALMKRKYPKIPLNGLVF